MAAKTKAPNRPANPPAKQDPHAVPPHTPPQTTEEGLHRIQALAQRIDKYVKDICAVGTLSGTSAEAKEKAVAAFHERMVVFERHLGRIHENLYLG